jgi:hypothetical protein
MLNYTSGKDGYQDMRPRSRMANETSGRNGFNNVDNLDLSSRVGHQPSSPPTGLHPGVTCDGCSANIVGVRYKCLACPNYDLCATCMDSHDRNRSLDIEFRDMMKARHPRDHYFVRIAQDVGRHPPAFLTNRARWVHHGVICAECRTVDIVGYRYFCTMCGTSYCEACEQKGLPNALRGGVHRYDHNLLKMVAQPQAPVPSEPSSGHK